MTKKFGMIFDGSQILMYLEYKVLAHPFSWVNIKFISEQIYFDMTLNKDSIRVCNSHLSLYFGMPYRESVIQSGTYWTKWIGYDTFAIMGFVSTSS